MDEAPPQLEPGDALIVVDVQNDFCPGGALPVPDGDAVVPLLNDWIARAAAGGAPVFASRDWHPPGHCSFAPQGGPWPEHCVQETHGAAFHEGLALPDGAVVVTKGEALERDAYSAFEGTGLAEELRRRGVRRLWIGGLALDYCVKATVLDALRGGFETHLLLAASRPVDVEAGDGARAAAALRDAGAVVHG